MKKEISAKKGAEAFSGIVKSTRDFGKKAADSAKNGVSVMVERSKSESYARRLKKYNPVFPDQYLSADFNLPNMIMIVDDAVRRDIDVCEGAIGWLGKDSGMEVLYLYDEAIEFSGIQFVPMATCDAVYYVDSFDRNRFIRTDCIFKKAHEERIAELKNIAYLLGARRCVIEIDESSTSDILQSKKASLDEKYDTTALTESAEVSFSRAGNDSRSGHVEIEFAGSDTPQVPELKWFAYDDNIKRLIEMRCTDKNAIKTETLELSGASSATMSQKTAYTIDCALDKLGGSSSQLSMDSQAKKEHHSKLFYIIEF